MSVVKNAEKIRQLRLKYVRRIEDEYKRRSDLLIIIGELIDELS